MPSKEMKKLFRAVKDHGWRVRRRRNNHFLLLSPDGEEKVFCSGTPSDHRAVDNVKSDLARAGLELED